MLYSKPSWQFCDQYLVIPTAHRGFSDFPTILITQIGIGLQNVLRLRVIEADGF